jgi:uncharacterized protein
MLNEAQNLKFWLQEIPTKEKEITHIYGVAEIIKALEERDYKQTRPVAPLEVRVRLLRSEKQVFVRGRILGRMELECSRCLDLFTIPIELEFQQTFLPRTNILDHDELELSVDDLDITYYSGEELNLAPIIWDELILGMPFSPLCRQDCQGLCSRCGANLNEGKCLCPATAGTSKWEALRCIRL